MTNDDQEVKKDEHCADGSCNKGSCNKGGCGMNLCSVCGIMKIIIISALVAYAVNYFMK